MFSDVLLTVDFDRTLTGPDTRIPQKNIEAIAYFMANGGAFTVNTGRTPTTLRHHLPNLPYNAPLLLFNGSASYWEGRLQDCKVIDLPVWPTLETLYRLCPDMHVQVQTEKVNYLLDDRPSMIALEETEHNKWELAQWGQDLGPFLKVALWGESKNACVADMYDCSQAELDRFNQVQAIIEEMWGDKVVCFRAAPRIIDVHAKGVSKALSAKNLQKKLGRKLLVCVGDAENDVSMLESADYAFCPADGVVADRFCNVCPCGDGAVADVIYNKLPEILKQNR